MVLLACGPAQRLEKAVGREITLCAERLRPGQVQGVFLFLFLRRLALARRLAGFARRRQHLTASVRA